MLCFYSAVGRDRHSCVLESSVRLSGFVGSLRACTFLYGDPDGERRRRGTRGTESAARQSAFLRDRISFAVFSAGSPLGAARPRLRQRAIGSLDSLHLIRGVGALYAAKGTRV